MHPKIIFKYSRVYDQNWQIWKKSYPFLLNDESMHFTIKEYFQKINKEWNQYQEKILTEISSCLNLPWKDEKINCYIIRQGIAFSDPLTIPVKKNVSEFVDILTHELIHCILTQNHQRIVPTIEFKKKYDKESKITQIHIIVHAVLKHIYLHVLGEEHLKKDIQRHKKKEYIRAWEIVESEGYETIINNFKSYYS
jgi:hypothetical protein